MLVCLKLFQFTIIGLAIMNVVALADSMCSRQSYQQCLGMSSVSSGLQAGILAGLPSLNSPNMQQECQSTVPAVRECLQGVKAACDGGQGHLLVKAAVVHLLQVLNFTCSQEGLTGYMQYDRCFTSAKVVSRMSLCHSRLSEGLNTRRLPVCTIFQRYRVCVAESVAIVCSEEAARFLDKVFKMTLKPVAMSIGINCNTNAPLTFECSASSPCKNEGQCKAINGRNMCKCKPGFVGPKCEIKQQDGKSKTNSEDKEREDMGKAKSEQGTKISTPVITAIIVSLVAFIVIIIFTAAVYIYCTRLRTRKPAPRTDTSTAQQVLPNMGHTVSNSPASGGGIGAAPLPELSTRAELPPRLGQLQPPSPDLLLSGQSGRAPAPYPRDSQQLSAQNQQLQQPPYHQPQEQPYEPLQQPPPETQSQQQLYRGLTPGHVVPSPGQLGHMDGQGGFQVGQISPIDGLMVGQMGPAMISDDTTPEPVVDMGSSVSDVHEYLKLYAGTDYTHPEYYCEVRDPGADMRMLLDLMKASSTSKSPT